MQSVCGFYRSGDWVIREALGQVLRMYDEGWGVNFSLKLRVCMLIVQPVSE